MEQSCTNEAKLQAPFPWFGGKSRVAGLVWSRFGDVRNYVEPFFGSGAVLLGRPTEPKVETVNDLDRYVANFWRAVQADPEAVAHHCDWPVNEADLEADLEARHYWLVSEGRVRLEAGLANPDWYDARIAGWWAWGVSSWIGPGWCSGDGSWVAGPDGWTKGKGGVNRQLPHLGNAGRGVNRQLPHLGDGGTGVNSAKGADIIGWLLALAARLRRVRVCCGDWSRVCGPCVTSGNGLTGVFLDPPYSAEAGRDMKLYSSDSGTVAHEVREWAIANGGNPLLRIALCGYEGEHIMPDDWDCAAWKAHGGYGSQGNGAGKENATRERVWFSPHCLRPRSGQLGLF